MPDEGERIQLRHDACGRLTERRVERDGFGPQRWRYHWDVLDRLVAVTQDDREEWRFRYDPFNRRDSKVRRFAQAERERAAPIWPLHVGGDGTPKAEKSSPQNADAGLQPVEELDFLMGELRGLLHNLTHVRAGFVAYKEAQGALE